MIARLEFEEQQSRSRRQGAVVLLFAVVLLMLLAAGGAGYVAVAEKPVRLGPYTLLGPRSQTVVWLTVTPAAGSGDTFWVPAGPASTMVWTRGGATWVSTPNGAAVVAGEFACGSGE